jgi:hypothetical protein
VASLTPSIEDPYSSSAREETATSRVAAEMYAASGKEAILTAVDLGKKQLQAHIANAPKIFSGKKLDSYLGDARNLQGWIRGLGKILQASDYVTDGAALLKADNDEERSGAGAHLGITFTKDIGSKGIAAVATRLFPRAAAALAGPVGWAAFVGSQVLTPTEISCDFPEVIRDSSGHTSLPQKQEALLQMWKQYDKFGASWKSGQKRELLQDTEIVYREAGNSRQ